MFNRAVIREGLTYGAACALIGFGALLILYFTGSNPFGAQLWLTLIILPVTLFFGVSQFKKYINPDIGFLQALSVALIISFTAAVLSGTLVFGLAHFAGKPAIDRHITELRSVLQASIAKTSKQDATEKGIYERDMKNLGNITPRDLALDDAFKKAGIGFLLSIIAATFYRK